MRTTNSDDDAVIPGLSGVQMPTQSLKILPVGDSITFGVGSSHGNGYRDDLRIKLSEHGYMTTFMGTQKNGRMVNDENEGFPLATIAVINQFITGLPSRITDTPDVILLHAGTNDWPWNPLTMTDHINRNYTSLLNNLHSMYPTSLIIAARIIHSTRANIDANITIINDEIGNVVVPAAQQKGLNVVVADMWDGVPGRDEFYTDALHPNDFGYASMAQVWMQAILDADGAGKIHREDRILSK